MPRKIEISHKTIIFTVLFLLFLWFLYQIREVIFIFFIALLIMTILNPTVTRLSQLKIPRALSILLIYLLILALFSVAVVGVIPPLVEQTTNLTEGLPRYLQNLSFPGLLSEEVINQVVSQIGSLPSYAVRVGLTVFSNVLSVFTVLFFAFYLLLSRERLDVQLASIFGDRNRERIRRLFDLLEKELGGWARGELLLMLFIGLVNFIGLTLLGIPFALPLAILAGILELVPNFGPVVAAIPAVIIGFSLSPLTGIAVIALAFLIQQFENYFLVPKIMEKSVGVSPIVTLLCLAIGLKIAGVIGILVAVPVFISLKVITKEYLASK